MLTANTMTDNGAIALVGAIYQQAFDDVRFKDNSLYARAIRWLKSKNGKRFLIGNIDDGALDQMCDKIVHDREQRPVVLLGTILFENEFDAQNGALQINAQRKIDAPEGVRPKYMMMPKWGKLQDPPKKYPWRYAE